MSAVEGAIDPAAVSLADVYAAQARISSYVLRTPLHPVPDGPLLKLESLQVTGSFKPRGAFNHVLALRAACGEGIITASSGNHGHAVAYVAKMLGLRAVVVVPEDVVTVKAQRITALGAELIRHGRDSTVRVALAQDLAARRGLHYVPPFDDPLVIAGQGTAGLEIVEQCPRVEAVLVPVSGGGLVSGIAVAIKGLRPTVRVIGVEPAGANRFARSRQVGAPVTLEKAETIADGLRVLTPGRYTWEVTRRTVDEFVAVDDEAILAAQRRLVTEANILAEPSGAASLAGALAMNLTGQDIVAVLSGGNADPRLLLRLLQSGS